MNSFWNKGEKDIIKGLDVLGVRGVDQHIETQLLASITTISIRARYLSLLPWIVGEFFDLHKKETNLNSVESRHILMQIFDRMELVLILSTAHEKSKDSSVLNIGIIGTEVHDEFLKEFNINGEINAIILKENAKREDYTNPSYGTYFNPCIGFGLLKHSPTAPVALPPRGKNIYEARKSVVKRKDGILDWLLNGGLLTQEMIADESKYFSIDHISSIPQEKKLLQEAFIVAFTNEKPDVVDSYNKFNDTLLWILEQLKDRKRPQELIIDNYNYCITKKIVQLSEIELNWFEFELRRRVHFSLELLLKALSHTLEKLNGATAHKVMQTWLEDIEMSNNYKYVVKSFNTILKEYHDSLDNNIFSETEPVNAEEQALFAISIIEVCRLQSKDLLEGISTVENSIDYMRKTFTILEEKQDIKVYEVLIETINFCVVEPHLKTTLRKMGQGQQCSLRFFPEGKKLIPTGIETNAGVSGSRLNNAIRMMSDIGFCEPLDNGTFIKNDMSDEVIARLKDAS